MHNELSYTTSEGYTVFTSKFLKNRGTCCKSTCLHCPYGYTLKKCGLEFSVIEESEFPLAESLVKESGNSELDWKAFAPEHRLWIKLKGETCGLALKNHIVVKHVFLYPHFLHQGLSKEMIESYLFI